MQMFEVKHFPKENGDPIAIGWSIVNIQSRIIGNSPFNLTFRFRRILV